MFDIEVDPYINRMIEIFHFTLIFTTDEATWNQKLGQKILFVNFIVAFPITITVGALQNESKIEALYLATLAILSLILAIKAYYAYSKKNDVIKFFNKMCVYSISDEIIFWKVKKTLRSFRNFTFVMLLLGTISLVSLMVACVYDNALPIKIWFPLNWEENKIYFWIAYCFVVINSIMAIAMIQFTALIWFIMINCALKYEVLGHRFRELGNTYTGNDLKVAASQDLIRCIQAYLEIKL